MPGHSNQDPLDNGQTAQELRDARQQLVVLRAYVRSLLDASLHPVVMISVEGKVTDLNTSAELATGHGRDELVGTDFSGWFSDPGLAAAEYAEVFASRIIRNRPLEIRHVDGHVTPVLFNGSVYRDPAGNVIGAFAALRDVTMVREASAALRESEERLQIILDNAPVGIDELTPTGEVLRVNRNFGELVGYGPGELLGRPIIDIIHPDDRAADLENTRRLLDGDLTSYWMEKRFLRKDGGTVWAEATRAIVRDQDGAPERLVGAVRDITAQRRAESEVRALNTQLEARVVLRTAELERANKNLEAFSYSVSHDLRAPLRAMSGYAEALVEDYGGQLDAAGCGYAERIQAAAERMSALIDDLLDLSRVSRAGIRLDPVDLSAEAARVAEDLRKRDDGRRVNFMIEDGVSVTADRTLIRSVLQNLLENAWKFTAQRDESIIEFGTENTDGGPIRYYVRDNGAGFDQAYEDKLFQPFQRLHAASDYPGTGIGLASVQRIIERHGGQVWARGAIDEGATFYFTLAPTSDQ